MESLVLPILVLIAISWTLYWRIARSRMILQSWEAKSGYSIVSARFCWFWRGPFFLRSTEQQSVFHVTVIDGAGKRRRGWVRCGSFWFGVMRDEAHVVWDE